MKYREVFVFYSQFKNINFKFTISSIINYIFEVKVCAPNISILLFIK